MLTLLQHPQSGPWCFNSPIKPFTFSKGYAVLWGARYGPLMTSDPYRWLTSIFIHQNFQHLISNTTLFTLLSWQIESKYGWWRLAFLWLLAVLGSGFFSAVAEDPCKAVVGSSGGIFGLVGLYIGDLVVNFE